MSDAESLHCPNCGAIADPGTPRCRYCQARLATISCPECFALMFRGSAFCPACGAAAERVEEEQSDARCPGCRSALRNVSIGSASLLECGRCDSVWVDAKDFERICADRESRAAVLHRWTSTAPGVNPPPVRYRPCARCGKLMNRVNFGRLSGTVVDVCRGHGTFLDPGELHAIVTFIEAGGLDKMREREIQDLKEEQRRLQAVERMQAMHLGSDMSPSGTLNSSTLTEFLRALLEP